MREKESYGSLLMMVVAMLAGIGYFGYSMLTYL